MQKRKLRWFGHVLTMKEVEYLGGRITYKGVKTFRQTTKKMENPLKNVGNVTDRRMDRMT